MKLKLRILSLITALVLTISLFTGCFGSDGSAYDDPDPHTLIVAEEPAFVDFGDDKVNEIDGRNSAESAANLDVEDPETAATTAETTTTTAATTTSSTAATTTPAHTTTAVTTATTANTTTSAATAAPSNPGTPAAVTGINNETFLAYTTICDKYKPASGKTAYLFNFNTSLCSGFGADGTVLPTEADYGIKGTVNGRMLTIAIYDHTGSASLEDLYLQALDAGINNDERHIQAIAKFAIDTTSYANGLYRIVAEFSGSRKIALYFYVNGNETWLCEQKVLTSSTEKTYETRRSELMSLLERGNATPENSLTLNGFTYPFKAFNEYFRCDTQLWIDLSNTFIDDKWSDEYKLYVIQEWVRENIAYDDFVKSDFKSRARYYSDYSGAQSVYNLRAGVCFDYVNIIAIMCRAHGIPTVTIGSTSMNHVWNVVYVNNRWMEYDACLSEQYHVGEDVTVRTKSGEPLYDGIYSPMLINNEKGKMPSDALVNQYLQLNTNNVY